MIKVTLDTNVIISALITDGVCRDVVESARKGEITLVLSPFILAELQRVLSDKFRVAEARVLRTVRSLENLALVVEPAEKFELVKRHATDNRIVECAVAGQVDYLVTGDDHILELKQYRSVKFLTPGEFLRVTRKS